MSIKSAEAINLQVVSDTDGAGYKTQAQHNGEHNIDDYNPHKFRSVPYPTTNMETLVHMLKGSLGIGILAMPQAFKNAGLASGIICTILIGLLCTYCLHILVNAQYELCKMQRVPILSYPDSMKLALERGPQWMRRFAPSMPPLVDTFMIVYQLGICCVYIVFVATNVKEICDYYIEYKLSIEVHMCILLIPLILLNCIRNLKLLAPFSTVANIVTFVGLALIMVYVLDDLPSPSSRDMVGEPMDFPLFFGTTLFALEAVGVIIALENNMKTPASFGCVLDSGMVVIVILYVLVGMLGYIKYGDLADSSITTNLPAGEIMSQSVRIIFAFAIFITYGLQCYVPVEIIWTTYMAKRLQDNRHKVLWEYGLRVVLVVATFILAVSVPRLGLFISLFGAFCLSALGIAFPAIMEICVLWPDQLGTANWILIKDVLLVIFGIVGLVVGTYTSLLAIVVSFQ